MEDASKINRKIGGQWIGLLSPIRNLATGWTGFPRSILIAHRKLCNEPELLVGLNGSHEPLKIVAGPAKDETSFANYFP